MSRSTISTFQIFELFPDAESARLYLESRLWPNGPICPVCNSSGKVVSLKRVGYYSCNACRANGPDEVFTVRSGTIFERSKIPPQRRLYPVWSLKADDPNELRLACDNAQIKRLDTVLDV